MGTNTVTEPRAAHSEEHQLELNLDSSQRFSYSCPDFCKSSCSAERQVRGPSLHEPSFPVAPVVPDLGQAQQPGGQKLNPKQPGLTPEPARAGVEG